ncbi:MULTISPECIES: helix-turn-helix domain-containing protein [unclassified Rhizobium]|uniref:helix-turn-helix domain-containing protein n=1 Tax=unclassified Rhizobium TaxID=2613769 RepID=UPI001615878B|nr:MULTISPECIES: helix-turn-helix domain-containing protein [unclassified Rhizobium]MBB3544823.1 transcriptional regulator with XRE-family HTH domain [Rhizobium sp. BK399]MCS3743466.1 transcriptional regulator with XRE-family HTH domain [Rhizobium sp. BK661]MCS4095508.1 transcriptional regulator with XRE-family HTH domain [Rhizobium sp. BK176]
MKAKTPNAIDAYVGDRVRQRRKLLGLSQVSLSESLGITFQQLQKYEKGVNRIGASRLQRISEVLGVPIGFFFEEGNDRGMGQHLSPHADEVASFIASKEGLALTRAFIAIDDPNIRRTLLALARSLGSSQAAADEPESWDRVDNLRG